MENMCALNADGAPIPAKNSVSKTFGAPGISRAIAGSWNKFKASTVQRELRSICHSMHTIHLIETLVAFGTSVGR